MMIAGGDAFHLRTYVSQLSAPTCCANGTTCFSPFTFHFYLLPQRPLRPLREDLRRGARSRRTGCDHREEPFQEKSDSAYFSLCASWILAPDSWLLFLKSRERALESRFD